MLSEFVKKVTDFAKANELFGSADRILLAVSGGADSTALLYAMKWLLDEEVLGGELLCAHINHQLRGYEADLDEQFVIAQAKELSLPITTKRVDVCEFARRNKLSIETSARKLRLESLLDIAKVNNCTCVATAHQKNDNAETIIHRLLRGTGFRGLAGIWPVQVFADGFIPLDNSANVDTAQNTTVSNGVNPSTLSTTLKTGSLRTRFVRPLLCVRRDEIIKYLQEQNLKWREDHTNADCTYTRNYIRHRLLPVLQQDYTGSPREIDDYDLSRRVKETNYLTGSIVEQLSLLAQQERKLNSLVREQTEKVWLELAQSSENSVALDLKRFLTEPKIVKVELIRRSITAIGSGERDLTQRHYEGIMRLAEPAISRTDRRKFELPGGFVVWRESGNLIFALPRRISVGEKQIISAGHLTVESVNLEVPGQTSILRRSPKDERFGRYLIEATISGTAILAVSSRAGSPCHAEKEDLEKFKAEKDNFVERFDLDKIKLPLVVRFRRKGDRFRPLGLPAEKKVGKFLTAARVPQELRRKVLIVADSEKIIWVWPIRISEQPKVSCRTRRVLQLRIAETAPS